jgi:hypothetical protein
VVGVGGGLTLSVFRARPHSFLQQSYGQKIKDDVNGFSSSSGVCSMVPTPNSPSSYTNLLSPFFVLCTEWYLEPLPPQDKEKEKPRGSARDVVYLG